MYVLLSGLPGSGKTTLAGPLADALRWPLLSKDVIKETLWDVVGAGDRAWSARLGAAAQEALLRLAADAPDAVIDTFVHHDGKHRLDALARPIVEVHCHCPFDIARDRCVDRPRHACHFDAEQVADRWDAWRADDAAPLGIGPLLVVDTTAPVDATAVATWVTTTGASLTVE
jgi:predicted kinase